MSDQETIKFAILGTGMVADYHRQAIEANAEHGARLVAVGHYNPDRFGEISTEFKVPCYSQEELLARSEIDVVCICTPSGQHAAQTIAAAEAGKHVLVEKPMALSLADADRMIEACEAAGVKLGVLLQRRSEAPFTTIKAAVDGGDLGNLTLGVVSMPYYRPQSYYEQAAWRGTWAMDGGGVLMNQGIHIVDLLVWFLGDPTLVQADAGTLYRDIEVEDTLSATLHFSNGALATITATTTIAPGFPHRIEIYGTNGGIQVDGETVGRWVLADPSKATIEPPATGQASDAGAGGDPRGIAATGHIATVQDFIFALRQDRSPETDGVEGRRSLATVLAIYEAAGLINVS